MSRIFNLIIWIIFSLIIFLYNDVYSNWVKITEVSGSSCILSFEDLILVGSNKGVYRSTDNGSGWTLYSVDNLTVTDLTRNNDYIFAGTYNGVYSSADTGKTWNYLGPSFAILSVYAKDSIIFACIQGGGLFRSVDNGKLWKAIDGNHFYSYLVDDNKIIAGTFTGVYESVDEGLTWYRTGLENKITVSLSKNDNYFFATNYTYGIYRSEDNGMTWLEVNQGLPLDNFHPYTVFAHNNLIFAGLTSNKIYLSTNNGLDWKEFSEGINISEDTYHVKFAISGNKMFVSFLYNSLWYCDLSEIVSLTEINNNTLDKFILHQNYPNPFNPVTEIEYSIPKRSRVVIDVFDLLGNKVSTLVNSEKHAGSYKVTFNGSNLSSGIYFCSLKTSGFIQTKKMVLMK